MTHTFQWIFVETSIFIVYFCNGCLTSFMPHEVNDCMIAIQSFIVDVRNFDLQSVNILWTPITATHVVYRVVVPRALCGTETTPPARRRSGAPLHSPHVRCSAIAPHEHVRASEHVARTTPSRPSPLPACEPHAPCGSNHASRRDCHGPDPLQLPCCHVAELQLPCC